MQSYYVTVRFALLITVVAVCVPTLGAQTLSPQRDSTRSSVTRVPFDGKDHFIRIAPMDSANIDNMPMTGHAPRTRSSVMSVDTIPFSVPDSVLHDFLKLDMKPLRRKNRDPL